MTLKCLFQAPFISKNITYGKFQAGAGNNTFPCGMASIAQYIRDKGYDVAYLEPNIEGMDLGEYEKYLSDKKFDVVCMSSTTLEIGRVIKTFEAIKKINPKITTVLGGIHATIMPEETLTEASSIDYLILGEGERSVASLMDCIRTSNLEKIKSISGIAFRANGRIRINPPDFKNMLSASEIPAPAYDLFPMRRYVAQVTYTKRFPSYTVVASRGCPFKCAFCNATDIFGRGIRYKAVDKVIDEIVTLKEKYGAKGIIFLDSTFTANRKWVEEFCSKYLELKINLPWACNSRVDTVDEALLKMMKDAGCWEILYGIESSNQKSLDLIDKRTTVEQNTKTLKLSMKLGFYTYASYIICLPGETEEDALNTIRYAKKLGRNYIGIEKEQEYLDLTVRRLR